MKKKEDKKRKMTSCWENLQHSLDIKFPQTTKTSNKMKPPLNSVKLLSFFNIKILQIMIQQTKIGQTKK